MTAACPALVATRELSHPFLEESWKFFEEQEEQYVINRLEAGKHVDRDLTISEPLQDTPETESMDIDENNIWLLENEFGFNAQHGRIASTCVESGKLSMNSRANRPDFFVCLQSAVVCHP